MGDEKSQSTLTIVERESGDSKTAKWATKRTAQVAIVTSVVLLLALVACVVGFVVMSKEHAKEQRRVIESTIKITETETVQERREFVTSDEEDVEIDTMTGDEGEQTTIFDYNRVVEDVSRGVFYCRDCKFEKLARAAS